MTSENLKITLGVSSGLLVGGAIGYFISRKYLEVKFNEILDEEVASVKAYYNERLKEDTMGGDPDGSKDRDSDSDDGGVSTSQKDEEAAKKEYYDIVEKSGYAVDGDDVEMFEEEYLTESSEVRISEARHTRHDGSTYTVQSVDYDKFDRVIPAMLPDPIDYEAPAFKKMVAERDPDVPYVITVDEYMDDNPHFEKQCLSYFEADNILCDERDIIVEDIESTVGEDNLDRFGEYSQDKHIVYVRNERISVDFEVAYHNGSYVDLVTGFKKRKMEERKLLEQMEDD